MKPASVLALVLVFVLSVGASCATSGDLDDVEGLDDSSDLSTTKDTFLIARHDQRRCISPVCGGYWVQDVNSTMQERYVSGFDFSGSMLDDTAQQQVTGAPDFELVLEGRLGPKENQFDTRPLRVIAAYRGMPGKSVSGTAKFYAVAPTKIACITQPCANFQTTRLNRTTGHAMATDVTVADAMATLVDEPWLHDLVISNHAVVAGKIVRSNHHVTVVAQQVFIQLGHEPPCPLLPVHSCPNGEIRAFERNGRCITPAECTAPGVCAPLDPTCDAGYTLVSWQNICPRFACEPEFLTAN